MKSKYVPSKRFRISIKNPEMQMVEKKATEKDLTTSVLLHYNGKKVHSLREEHHLAYGI